MVIMRVVQCSDSFYHPNCSSSAMLVAYLYWYANTQMKSCTTHVLLVHTWHLIENVYTKLQKERAYRKMKRKGLTTGGTYRQEEEYTLPLHVLWCPLCNSVKKTFMYTSPFYNNKVHRLTYIC